MILMAAAVGIFVIVMVMDSGRSEALTNMKVKKTGSRSRSHSMGMEVATVKY